MEKGYRNISMDVFRGIAAMMIIFHHVASYSGAVYSPYEIIPSTMLVDVPAFMFISGWAFQYTDSISKMTKRLLRLMLEYVIFSAIYIVFIEAFEWIVFNNVISIEELLFLWVKQSVFRGTNHEIFSVVNASLWFMPMYVKVYMLFGLIILIIKKLIPNRKWQDYMHIVVTILSFLLFFYMQKGNGIRGISVTTLFYGTFFMLGHVLMSKKAVPTVYIATAFIANFFLLVGLEHYTDMSIYGMVNNKFPPSIMFFIYSLFYILVMLLLGHYPIKKEKFFSYMGRTALFFFFAQGFSVSLINMIDDYILIQNWIVKYSISCLIALLLTFLIAILLKKMIEGIWNIFAWVVE